MADLPILDSVFFRKLTLGPPLGSAQGAGAFRVIAIRLGFGTTPVRAVPAGNLEVQRKACTDGRAG
jgi:hypothetical protein